VISAAENSSKFPKKKPILGKEKSVEDMVTLGGPTAQTTLVLVYYSKNLTK
jgi:hypothetical protein